MRLVTGSDDSTVNARGGGREGGTVDGELSGVLERCLDLFFVAPKTSSCQMSGLHLLNGLILSSIYFSVL